MCTNCKEANLSLFFSYPKRTYLLAWLQIYSLLHHESDNALLFSLHCPPKCANHIYSHWFRTELKNGFWCQAFSNWPIRNDMDSLFRLPKMCTLSLPVRIDNAQTKNIAFETGTNFRAILLLPLFWTYCDVSCWFQSQSGQPYLQLTEAYGLNLPSARGSSSSPIFKI